MVQQLANQCARQVVGNVAGHNLATLRKGARHVETEDVGLDYFDVRVAGEDVAQHRDEAQVQLHRDEATAAWGQGDGQCAGARADLEHLILTVRARGFGDRVAGLRVDQEVLAQTVLEGDAVALQQPLELLQVGRVDHFIF